MVKNLYGEAPNAPITTSFTAGVHSEALPNGYYVMTETQSPGGTQGLMAPICFTVFNGAGFAEDEKGLRLTDASWQNPMDYEGVEVSGSGEIYIMNVANAWQRVSVPVSGTKVLLGREMTRDDRFTFLLEPAQAQVAGETYPGLDGSDALRTQNDADRSFAFELNYSTADYLAHRGPDDVAVFTYRLTEVAPEWVDQDNFDPTSGIVYSREAFWVRVKLGLDEDGRLTVLDKEVFDTEPDAS